MNDAISRQREAAEEVLREYEAELQSAESELQSWEAYDMRRSDGSGAQDARHEKLGQDAKERVYRAQKKVSEQRAWLAKMPG